MREPHTKKMVHHGMQQRLGWYWQRLRRMSAPELGYRLGQMVRRQCMASGWLTAEKVPAPEMRPGIPLWPDEPPGVDPGIYIRSADAVIHNGVRFFGLHLCLEEIVQGWNRDPKTGAVAPLKFGMNLNYRDPSVCGDIKYLWEPNRHLFLVPLAQAYALSRAPRYLRSLAVLLRSWLDQCPYLKGPNWTSALELGIRLINWSWVWTLIGGSESPMFEDGNGRKLRDDWLAAIYRHAHFIRHHFSRFSSANNHLIGEAAGLFVAGLSWPYWDASARWAEKSRDILMEEALRQNTPDGVNREQAISYQQFVLDFLIMSGLAARAGGMDFPDAYWERIEAMIGYIDAVMDVDGHVPMIGDADDGFVVQLARADDFCPYRSLLATGSVLFNRPEWMARGGGTDEKSIWLLGKKAVQQRRKDSPDVGGHGTRQDFPLGGYYLMGKDFGTPREIKAMIDCGPLGYLSIAAHGHADALSLLLTVCGNEILIDPGTFAYHNQSWWRNYFRGTSAHNTVRVDGVDQSQISGSFMWSTRAESRCLRFETGKDWDHFSGYHDGYQRLRDPVVHRREISFDKRRLAFRVDDVLSCGGSHEIERSFHFSENCRVVLENNSLQIDSSGVRVTLMPTGSGSEIRLYRGDEVMPMGWVSRHYDLKTPTCAAVIFDRINGTTRLGTRIQIEMGQIDDEN